MVNIAKFCPKTKLTKIHSNSFVYLQSLLTDSSNREVWPQLLDIYGSCRNARAHQAAVSSVGNPSKTSRPDLYERYLWSAAQVATPSVSAVKELAKTLANSEIEDEKLFETLVLSLGTLSRKTDNSKVRINVITTFVTK